MSIVKDLIKSESDGTISFGDFTLDEKAKKSDFEVKGDIYKVKTFKEVTKLEKNELFVYESIPGTAVNSLNVTPEGVSCKVEGKSDTSITFELLPDTEYIVKMDGKDFDTIKTKLGGKLNISVDLELNVPVKIEIIKA